MANERALGVSFIVAIQTWRQLVVCYGEDTARTLLGLSNNVIAFGGGKDTAFYRDLCDLTGSTTHLQLHHSDRAGGQRGTWVPQRVPVIEPAELRTLPTAQVLLLADECLPIIAKVRRCIQGRRGRQLLRDRASLRSRLREHDDA